jgi:diadenosine tetraphosphate (Ap4A) HIT family hydrolase
MDMQTHRSSGDCEFCLEIEQPRLSRYHTIYGPDARSRIVDRQGELVAMPSLGQIFKGSLMVLPARHVETIADLEPAEREDVLTLVDRLRRKVSALGLPVVFEHGARCQSGGGCGIYHAHLHVVPVPAPVTVGALLPGWTADRLDLGAALANVSGADQYLLLQDTQGEVAVGPLGEGAGRAYPSQYFRQVLCRHFSIAQDWDWRSYEREPRLAETIAWYAHA